MENFYDELSPFYHLIYPDWEASIERQAAQIDDIIRTHWPEAGNRLLDVACGIGTQCLGLARHGWSVTASDLSGKAIERAREEAAKRALEIDFSVCDMRGLDSHPEAVFDIVLAADNALPHLLTDDEILLTLEGMRARLKPGGACIITVRDYALEQRGQSIIKPFGIRDVDNHRYVIWQVWDFDGDCYDFTMYFVDHDRNSGDSRTDLHQSRYYAIDTDSLMKLMQQSGFTAVARVDDAFFQPVLIGTRPVEE